MYFLLVIPDAEPTGPAFGRPDEARRSGISAPLQSARCKTINDSGFAPEPVIGPRLARTRWTRPGMTVDAEC
jgi:hypothetical protein